MDSQTWNASSKVSKEESYGLGGSKGSPFGGIVIFTTTGSVESDSW